MKILVLDCNVRYMNPTRTHFPRFLSLLGDVHFFGPGYCSTKVLQVGLEEFINNHGPFNLAFATEHVGLPARSSDLIEKSVQFYKKSFIFRFSETDLRLFWKSMPFFYDLSIFKCAALMQFDFQSATKKHIDNYVNNYQMVIAVNKQFVRSYGEDPSVKAEGFNVVNDNWYEFVLEYNHKILPLMHFMTDGEFEFRSLSNRNYDWSVPGTLYQARKKANSVLKTENLLITSNRKIRKLMYIAEKVGLNPYATNIGNYLFSQSFSDSISDSRFSYTCGSALGVVVRKFFEIPALGTVLVCKPCNGFEYLGFINGVNAITSSPEGLADLSSRLKKDLDYAQAIADAGQKLILEKHTLHVRAKQLKKALLLGLKGEFQGAKWKNGDLVLLPPRSNSIDDEIILC
jgi:hypothetical protein